MALLFLRLPIVCVLVISIGHVPVPWLHRHQGMDDEQFVGHTGIYHSQAAEYELPDGWHVHFLCLGPNGGYLGECQEDGWQVPPTHVGNHLHLEVSPLAFELELNRLTDRAGELKPNRISDPCVTSGSLRFAAKLGSAVHFLGASLCAENHLHQELCVLLI